MSFDKLERSSGGGMARITSSPTTNGSRRARHLLAKEKEFTRPRDQLSRERRELPWEKVEKAYTFEAAGGTRSLGDLFGGSQLVIYHFMFGPDWDEGCPSCSFWADNFNGIVVHLNHRDVTLVAVSRAPLARHRRLQEAHGLDVPVGVVGRQRLQLRLPRLVQPRTKARAVDYNYDDRPRRRGAARASASFAAARWRDLPHLLDLRARPRHAERRLPLLDLVPKGRDEEGLPLPMAWVRRHDSY